MGFNYLIYIPDEIFQAFDQGMEIEQKPYYAWDLKEGDTLEWLSGMSNARVRRGVARITFVRGSGFRRVCGFIKVSDKGE